jgi:hypothetical protein
MSSTVGGLEFNPTHQLLMENDAIQKKRTGTRAVHMVKEIGIFIFRREELGYCTSELTYGKCIVACKLYT